MVCLTRRLDFKNAYDFEFLTQSRDFKWTTLNAEIRLERKASAWSLLWERWWSICIVKSELAHAQKLPLHHHVSGASGSWRLAGRFLNMFRIYPYRGGVRK